MGTISEVSPTAIEATAKDVGVNPHAFFINAASAFNRAFDDYIETHKHPPKNAGFQGGYSRVVLGGIFALGAAATIVGSKYIIEHNVDGQVVFGNNPAAEATPPDEAVPPDHQQQPAEPLNPEGLPPQATPEGPMPVNPEIPPAEPVDKPENYQYCMPVGPENKSWIGIFDFYLKSTYNYDIPLTADQSGNITGYADGRIAVFRANGAIEYYDLNDYLNLPDKMNGNQLADGDSVCLMSSRIIAKEDQPDPFSYTKTVTVWQTGTKSNNDVYRVDKGSVATAKANFKYRNHKIGVMLSTPPETESILVDASLLPGPTNAMEVIPASVATAC